MQAIILLLLFVIHSLALGGRNTTKIEIEIPSYEAI